MNMLPSGCRLLRVCALLACCLPTLPPPLDSHCCCCLLLLLLLLLLPPPHTHTTQAAYDKLLFREALKVAGYDLGNARDAYRWVFSVKGEEGLLSQR
jgi:hypothetical protein